MARSHGYVLVVEDDATIREVVVGVLGDEGFDVEIAADGQAALDVLAEAGPPRLILLDMMMPVMDGLEFLHEKDARAAWAAIPVCIMTANREQRPDLPGVVAFLRKPFNLDALIAIVDRYCSASASGAPVGAARVANDARR